MAGYAKNKERLEAVQLLGKDLARRARSKCELCETAGVRLDPFEPPPVETEPSLDRIMLLCERCRAAADGGPLKDDSEWRFLETVVWSDLAPVQVVAIRLLRRLRDDKVGWANSTLEMVYPNEDTQAWLDS